jgi:glycosyltransferase involved in cell wall biosynthesis
MSNPIISVTMPVYNGERYVSAAVESILNQTFTNFELIIVDDGSTDSTSTILHSYRDSRIHIVTNPSNWGISRTRNRALSLASGRYIVPHDADDISVPERFSQQVDFLEAHPEMGVVGSAYALIDSHGNCIDEVYPFQGNTSLQKILLKGNPFCHGSLMLRRESLVAVGDYNMDLAPSEDYDLLLRISEKYQVANLDRLLYWYRFNPAGASVNKFEQQYRLALEARRLAYQRRGLHYVKDEREWAVGLLYKLLYLVLLWYVTGDYNGAAQLFKNVLLLCEEQVSLRQTVTNWILNEARRFLEKDPSYSTSVHFLHWSTDLLDSQYSPNTLVEHFYISNVFTEYQRRNWSAVTYCLPRGIWYAPHWLTNAGVWSIGVRAYIHNFVNKIYRVGVRGNEE